jgi:hypothetical protein
MPSGNQAVTFVFSEGLDAIPAITKAAVRKNITQSKQHNGEAFRQGRLFHG